MVATPVHVDIRAGAVSGLVDLLDERRISSRGQIAVVLGSGLGDQVLDALGGSVRADALYTVRDGALETAVELARDIGRRPVDVVVGIGGGRTLDVTKYAAARLGAPMVSVATTLAHDGLASPVSVLEVDGRRNSYGVPTPIATIVDLEFVRRAPERHIRSGIGDAVSNLSALEDWRLASRVTGEPFDGLASAFARAAGESVLHGTGDLRDERFLTTLGEALVLSGLAMSVAGTSRPCSGACHEISHALDRVAPGRASHGEQVGVGALFATFLRGDDRLFDDLLGCLRRLGCPTSPRALGVSVDEFARAVADAPDTRPDRYTILEHLDLTEAEIRLRVTDFEDRVTVSTAGSPIGPARPTEAVSDGRSGPRRAGAR